MRILDIAIAGAGPAGLAAALNLHRDGHRVTLFERFETPHPVGSGLILQPTGLAVLHEFGLHRRMARLGAPLDRLIGHDAKSGRVVLDVRYASLRGVGRGLGVHRAALFNVLNDAVTAAAIPVRTGFIVSAVERDGARMRLVANGQSEGPFDLVVDALGASSPLKPLARGHGSNRPLSFGALWATVPWVEGFESRALMQRYRKARVMIGVLPIGRQIEDGPALAAFFWSLKWAEYEALQRVGFATWQEVVLGHWPDAAPHLSAIGGFGQMTLARYAHHTLAVPAGDGIAFVGDSAHATSPQLGQGANMALLDARALTVALRQSDDVAGALARYAAFRRWHVRLYQALSRSLTPFYQSDSTVLPMIRDVFVSYLARIPPAPQFLAAMVAGQLLSPIKALGLELPPLLEDG